MEDEERGKVRGLIDKATNSTAAEVDPRLLKAIKSLVRFSDSELRLAAHTLLDLMKRDHSQVRYLTLLIIDELFMRSKLFRSLLVENLDQLLTLSVGFRRNMPLPAPPAVASALRTKAIEFLEKWNISFGLHYRQLRLGFDYLKNTLRLQFPNLQANRARIQQERSERERRTQEILRNKYETLKENFIFKKEEIQSTVDEIGACLNIVRRKGENPAIGAFDEEDMVEFQSSELRQIRLASIKEGEKVRESSENKVVFDALRELYKLLVTKYMVSVQEWISLLVRVEASENRVRDCLLRESIDIRNRLMSIKKECEELGCTLPKMGHHHEEEEDIWEEVQVKPINNNAEKHNDNLAVASTSGQDGNPKPVGTSSSGKHLNGNKNDSQASSSAKVKDKNDSQASPSAKVKDRVKESSDHPVKSKLLSEAPVIPWGSFLDNWGSKRDFLANQRGLELENHWGRVEQDAVIPAEKIAELNLRITVYQEKEVEIQPCRAPLSKGGLCQRRDLKVCPFHGPIIPRDDNGIPINHGPVSPKISEFDQENDSSQSLLENEKKLDSGSDMAAQLAKQAARNVRNSDKEEARNRKFDKQMMKRAKLAKVREHNETVLRDAAFASSSRSEVLWDEEGIGEDKTNERNRKRTLASMLRQKETRKDRLAKRLLSSRANDATIRQMTESEDSNYREAFPNQW